MDKEIFEENDRNIRVFGLEIQKKLFNTEVLVLNITTMTTELSKNLVLSGVKLCLFDDSSTINEKDTLSNFFLNKNEIGKNKTEIIKSKLLSFKTTAIISIINNIEEIKNKKIKFAVIDLSENYDTNLLKEIECIFKEIKSILYYVKVINDKAFFLNNILEKKFIEDNKNKEDLNKNKLTADIILNDDEEENEKTQKEINDVNAIDLSNEEKNLKKNDEEKINSENDYMYYDMENKIEAIEKNVIPEKMKEYVTKQIKDTFELIKGKEGNEKENILNNLCSFVIGGVVCHECINCISLKKNPRTNIYYYDAFNGNGKFLNEIYDN